MHTKLRNCILSFLTLLGLGMNAAALTTGDSLRIPLTDEEIASLSAPPPAWADEVEGGTPEQPHVCRGCAAYPVVMSGESDTGPQYDAYVGTNWTNNTVYYQFNANVTSTNQTIFRNVCREISSFANVKFVEGTGAGNYIAVESGTANFSAIGMVGGAQTLQMVNWDYPYILGHEILHALGCLHEQSRSDRDTFVTINFANITSGDAHNFDIDSGTSNYGPYDFGSVMHYGQKAFGINGAVTITCKTGYTQFQNTIGQTTQFSALDKAGLSQRYPGTPQIQIDLKDDGEQYQGVSVTSVVAGNTVSVENDIRNGGTSPSGTFEVKFYLSWNNIISDADTLLGTVNMPAINGNDYGNCDLSSAVVPSSLTPGDYYVGWIIDSANAVPETNEFNNIVLNKNGVQKLTVIAPAPIIDLKDDGEQYQGLSSTSVVAGKAVSAENDIRNGGTSPSGTFEVKFYLSTNNTITTTDTLLGTVNMPSINGNDYGHCDLSSAVVPSNLPPGDYYVGWIIDPAGAVTETDKGNNAILYKSGVQKLTVIAPAPIIDLKDDGEQYQYLSSTSAADGNTVSVVTDLRNAGTSPSGTFEVKFYLSWNNIISDADTLLGTVIMPSINGNDFGACDLYSAVVPSSLPPGDYYVGWIIDSAGAVTETDESNNNVLYKSGVQKLTVTAPPTVTTPTQTAITSSGATVGGNVTSDGGSAIIERGVVYSLTSANSNPKISGTSVTKKTSTDSSGAFTIALTGLEPGKGYSFKAYAKNAVGTTYTSPVSTFTTLAVAPTVTTPTQTSITSSSAKLGGKVISDGGSAIIERGVVYSLTSANSNPKISGTSVSRKTSTDTSGAFTISITGLKPGKGYSFKAYAKNAVGTTYTSPVSTFTTAAAIVAIHPTAESVTSITDGSGSLADTWKTLTTIDPKDGLKYLTIVITKAPGTEQQRRIVEVSDNLTDWYSGKNHTSVLRDNADILKVRDNTPLTPGKKRYIRLKPPLR